MKNLFVRFSKDKSGATAIEYGLIAAGISVAIAVVVFPLGAQDRPPLFSEIEAKQAACRRRCQLEWTLEMPSRQQQAPDVSGPPARSGGRSFLQWPTGRSD